MIDDLEIRAERTEAMNNNLAQRFLQSLSERFPATAGRINEVYNLTINGSGRYYFTPNLGVFSMYFLG